MEQLEVKYAPGMRIIVRGEEWMVKKVDTNSLGNQTLHVIGLSKLVKNYESRFFVDVEDDIEIVDPAKVTLVPDDSAFFRKSKVYIVSHRTDLHEQAHVSTNAIATMGKCGDVSTKVLDKICKTLDCQIHDIVDYVPDDDDVQEN